jgi:hypothetical protein
MCEYSLTPQFLVNNKYLLQAGSTLNLLADYGSCASCNLNIAQLAENTNTFCIPKTLDNSDEV